MNVIAETVPDLAEGFAQSPETIPLSTSTATLSGSEPVGAMSLRSSTNLKNTLIDRLGHHDGAQEVAISIKVDALRRGSCKMVIGNDALMEHFEVPIDPDVDGLLEIVTKATT